MIAVISRHHFRSRTSLSKSVTVAGVQIPAVMSHQRWQKNQRGAGSQA